MIAIDTETHLIKFHTWTDEKGKERRIATDLRPKVVCLTFCSSVGSSLNTGEQIPSDIKETLARGDLIVGANIAFDFGVLTKSYPDLEPLVWKAYDEGRIFDVLLAESLDAIYYGTLGIHWKTNVPNTRYSLAYCVDKYLGIDLSEVKTGVNSWRMRYSELDGVPVSEWPEDAIKYAMEDAEYTYQVAKIQREKCRNLEAMPEQARAAWALHLTACNGMRADPTMVAKLYAEWNSAHDEAVKRFSELGWIRPDGSKDTKRIAQAVTQAFQGKPPTTPKGRVSMSHETLSESGNEELEAFAGIAKTEKLRTTYLPVLRAASQQRISPHYNVLVATGRTSCDTPNLQNLPRKGGVRECFIPDDGYLFAFADYSTLELCTLAQTCIGLVGYSRMGDAINKGLDTHLDFASDFLGVPYDALKAQYKAGDKKIEEVRQLAKAFNFGLPGGLGPVKFIRFAWDSYHVHVCEVMGEEKCGEVVALDERSGTMICTACHYHVQDLRRRWFEKWPEVVEYHQIIQQRTRDGRGRVKVVGPPGGIERGGCGFCDGANTGFQGLAGRLAKAALYAVVRESRNARSPLYGSRPIVFVHDEIGAEVPIDRASDAAEFLAHTMEAYAQTYLPDVQVKAEPVLMSRWYKGAKQTRDTAGRLIPFVPKS